MAKFAELMEEAQDAIGAKRIYAPPYEKNGVTVIPAARIMGGAGGGEGSAPAAEGDEKTTTGTGGGYGLSGRPVGAYVIKGDSVTWLPAIDVNRLMLGFQIVMIVFFLSVRSVMKARATARLEEIRAGIGSKG